MEDRSEYKRWDYERARFALSRIRDRAYMHGYVLALSGSILYYGEGQDLDLVAVPYREDAHDPVLVANDIAYILMLDKWLVFDEGIVGIAGLRGFVMSLEHDGGLVDLTIMRCGE